MIPLPFSPRLLVIGASIAAILIAGLGLYYRGRTEQAAKDRAAVAASQTQARVSDVTAKALDTHTTQTIVIKERESRAIETVQKAPGAGDLLPPDLLAAFQRGLLDIKTGPGGGDGPGVAAGTVPAP